MTYVILVVMIIIALAAGQMTATFAQVSYIVGFFINAAIMAAILLAACVASRMGT